MKKSLLAWGVKLLVSALLLGLVLRRVHFKEILQALSAVNVGVYLMAVGLSFTAHGLNSYKWQRLLSALGMRKRFVHLWALNLVSLFYSLVLPGQLFGEAMKAYRLARGRQGKAHLVMSVIVDRLTGMIAVLCLGLMGLLGMPAVRSQRPLWIVTGVLLCACLLIVCVMFNARWQEGLARVAGAACKPRWLNALKPRLQSVWTAFIAYRQSPQMVGVALLLSFGFQSLLVVNNYCVARGMGLSVSLLQFFWIMAIISLVQMLPITLAGLGAREGVFVYLLGFEGVSAPQAIALSLTMFGAGLVVRLTGGALDLWGYPRLAAEPVAVQGAQVEG